MTSQGSRDHCYNTVVGVCSLSPIHPPLNGFQKVATIFLSELIAGPEGPLHTQQRMYIFLSYLSSFKLAQLFGVHICKLDHTVFNLVSCSLPHFLKTLFNIFKLLICLLTKWKNLLVYMLKFNFLFC